MNVEYLCNLFSLDGKRAVVTGAGQGIGRATALSLAQFGAHVTGISLRQSNLDEMVALIEGQGGAATGIAVDVSNQEAVDEFFDDYLAQHGGIDIFVNNAAFTVEKRILDTQKSDMEGLLATNVLGAMYGLKRAGRAMREQKSGNIVIVTSVNALSPLPPQGFYSSTKASLESIMKSLAADLAPCGVRVNSVVPGAIDTNMNSGVFADPAVRAMYENIIPLRRIGDAPDIGDMIAVIVSDAGRYMAGSSVVIDGGLLIREN